MSLIGEYDPENVFAKIIRGELPAYKVFEDDHVLAFLDLFPQARGHTLVIPKKMAARNILEADDETLTHLILAAKKLSALLVEVLQSDGIQILQFNGGTGGQTVFHIHFHLIPRWPGQPVGLHAQNRGDDAELESLARLLSAKLSA